MARVLRPELEAAIESAGGIAREVLAPNAERVDRENAYPYESTAAVRSSGLLGLLVPREYGGLEADPRTFCRIVFELGRACPSTAMIFVMHCGVTRNIGLYGGEPTRRRFLPRIAAGELFFSSSRNEPQASATQGYIGELKESLTPTPDGGYVFNTMKFFVSGSTGVDYFGTTGRVVGSRPGEGELWVLIDARDPGLEVVENWDTLGMRATRSNYVYFRDCVVEPDAMLGRPGPPIFGDYAVFGQAVVSLAIGQNAFDFGVRFLRGEVGEIHQGNLAGDVNAQREIGECELLLDAAKMVIHQASLAIERGSRPEIAAAIQRVWYHSRIVGSDVPYRILQVVGGRGAYRRLPLERFVRDGETIALMGPSRPSLATGIGKAMLGDGPKFEGCWLD